MVKKEFLRILMFSFLFSMFNTEQEKIEERSFKELKERKKSSSGEKKTMLEKKHKRKLTKTPIMLCNKDEWNEFVHFKKGTKPNNNGYLSSIKDFLRSVFVCATANVVTFYFWKFKGNITSFFNDNNTRGNRLGVR